MPMQLIVKDDMIETTITGRVGDDDLVPYYEQQFFHDFKGPWLELIDGTGITEMAVTFAGNQRLAGLAERRMDALRGGRVAMVATAPAVYGAFRMWEIMREDLDYEVRVFLDRADARAWVLLARKPKS